MGSNPFLDAQVAAHYENWYEAEGRQAVVQEKVLLRKLLGEFSQAHSMLEVGCGTGHFTRWFASQGLKATGLDISEPMLAEAARRGPQSYAQGDALALPFGDRSFDLVAFVTALEFVPDPEVALAEAGRVARHGIVLGVLNRNSVLGWQRRRSGVPPWQTAHFFTVEELKETARRSLGGRLGKVTWRTTLWPLWAGDLPLPWGGFIGMSIKLG